MKKLLVSGSVAIALLPMLALAAYDDVTLTTDVSIPLTNATLTINSTSAVIQSITVIAGSMTFDLQPGSSVDVINSVGKALIIDQGGEYLVADSCSGGSRLKFVNNSASASVSITITPSSSACSGESARSAASSGGGSSGGGGGPPSIIGGGGGGGGGGSVTPATTPATTPASTPATAENAAVIAQLQVQIQQLIAQLNALLAAKGLPLYASSSFTRDLEVGLTGADVKALQVYLNTKGYVVAASGPGSPGNETTRFGNATKAALIKLQKAAGISPASGFFGPKTRAYVNANP
ncbi:MAG: peptidoglycan-binding protein [Candidatus Kaiserbacteria bacterium]|nr:MAG: peptidoglycan-binding protein [Candidatus Kaiserbacteria bacterium]